eukprot:scaffold1836_cov181-Pinguiococcus_pyrenoidosus.AAC.3
MKTGSLMQRKCIIWKFASLLGKGVGQLWLYVRRAPFNCERKSSQLSESNHSSVHRRNDTNGPLQSIFEILPRYLMRLGDLTKEAAQKISLANSSAVLYENALPVKKKAFQTLTTYAFTNTFDAEYDMASQYRVVSDPAADLPRDADAQESEGEIFIVTRIDGTGTQNLVRAFPHSRYHCRCPKFTAYMAFCRHTIATDCSRGGNGFHSFPDRWRRPKILERSPRRSDPAPNRTSPSTTCLSRNGRSNPIEHIDGDAATTVDSNAECHYSEESEVVCVDLTQDSDSIPLNPVITQPRKRYTYKDLMSLAKKICSLASASSARSRTVMAALVQVGDCSPQRERSAREL